MNLAQRVILFFAGVLFVILALVVIIDDNLRLFDFLIFGFMIMVPTLLFHYSFSHIKKKIDTVANPSSNQSNIYINENTKKLNDLVQVTANRLYKLSSVFPFDLFPDDIIIEQKQIILIHGQFFASSQDYHILIKDILMPVVENSVFFSTLRIELGPGGFQQNPPSISFLKKSEAFKAKRIIMGLIICDREKIDLSGVSREEIVKKVEEIGRISNK